MTVLGASLYASFFGVAALWLLLTAERAEAPVDQPNDPERSNSVNAEEVLVGSSPCSASHSSQK
jgi:hypothetical protein